LTVILDVRRIIIEHIDSRCFSTSDVRRVLRQKSRSEMGLMTARRRKPVKSKAIEKPAMRKVLLDVPADVLARVEVLHKKERAARPGHLTSRADVLRALLLDALTRAEASSPGETK
jgi:hypothetical protein